MIDEDLALFIDVFNFTVFFTYTGLALYVLIRLRFKADLSVISSIICCWLCITTRTVTLLYGIKDQPNTIFADNYLTLLDINLVYINYIVLYYLTYEMRSVFLMFMANSIADFSRKAKQNVILFMTLTFVMLIMLGVRDVIEMMRLSSYDTNLMYILLDIVIPISKGFILITDTIVFILAVKYYFFFLSLRLRNIG